MKKVSVLGIGFLTAIAFAVVMMFNACSDDPCKDVTCLNGGTCVDGTCNCAAGYEGTDCSTESRTKFFGSWAGVDQCTNVYNYTATVATSASDVTKVLVTNPFAVGTNVTVSANIDGTNISIPVGSSGNGFTFSGNGTITSDGHTINWASYTITDSYNNTETCSSTWALQ